MDHNVYQSPFSWRYGSHAMRALWSEANRRRLMRQVWLALATAQHEAGLVSADQLAQLQATAEDIDIDRATELEERTRHDVMAEILCWAEQVPEAGGIIHLGATSADITDNVDALRIRDGLAIVRTGLREVIEGLAERVAEFRDVVTLGWTHIQPAAPTTVGYRLASTLQDLLGDLDALDGLSGELKGKGFKGAVGTGASYAALLSGTDMSAAEMERRAMDRLGLDAASITTQVYPRKMDWLVLVTLSGIGLSLSTLAFNIRLLQSPPFGEWSEGFLEGQVGSSAMPWKRNPINAENLNSLARYLSTLPTVAWHNQSSLLLERTLDDSANRRIVLPNAFLAVDEILHRAATLVRRLQVEQGAINALLDRFGPFVSSERVLVAAARAGGDRQELHERIRTHSLTAWAAVERGDANPLAELLATDATISSLVSSDKIRTLVADPASHVGDAPARAMALAERARERLEISTA